MGIYDMWVVRLDVTEPMAIGDLKLKAKFNAYNKKVKLEWNDLLNLPNSEYTLLKAKNLRKDQWDTLIHKTKNLSFQDDNIKNDVRYYYKVCRSGQNECSAIVEVKGHWDENFSLYPNPAKNMIQIILEQKAFESVPDVPSISFHDALGKSMTPLLLSIKKNVIEYDISTFSPGIYIIKVDKQVSKLVVE